jgi:class 3 adenylate cyclase
MVGSAEKLTFRQSARGIDRSDLDRATLATRELYCTRVLDNPSKEVGTRAMAATCRLAAILAADVVGYSRLMGEDEEGTLAALKTLWRDLSDPKIKEHHGRIVKTTGEGRGSISTIA